MMMKFQIFFLVVLGMSIGLDSNADESISPPGRSVVDFRYSPPSWQTAICLPDDWQKTLVGKDGVLLYDFQNRSGFMTSIKWGNEDDEWLRQELVHPRIPIVKTHKRSGGALITETAFAVAPRLGGGDDRGGSRPTLKRMLTKSTMANWASPPEEFDPAFRHIAAANGNPIYYRFCLPDGCSYTVVLGLCEGYWEEAGKRPLELVVEGDASRIVDAVADRGANVPGVYSFDAKDADGDGWIDIHVNPIEEAPDQNVILNVIWIFPTGDVPSDDDLLRGLFVQQPIVKLDCGGEAQSGPPRNDVVVIEYDNPSEKSCVVTPQVSIETKFPVSEEGRRVLIGSHTKLVLPDLPYSIRPGGEARRVIQFEPLNLAPGEKRSICYGIARGDVQFEIPSELREAYYLMKQSETYWRNADLPYECIQVPDPAIQAQIDSAIRNIYQAREIKDGLPAFQVGPTVYRGLWVVDGSFLMEAVSFLGRLEEARAGIRYLLNFQREDGAFMLIDGHWKETGIVLWAATRHAVLAHDRDWLESVWPQLMKGWDYIQTMRDMSFHDDEPLNDGLLPVGFSDGGLGGRYPEYTNVYWTLSGMKAAVDAARWLGKKDLADVWRDQYREFYSTFQRSAKRDMKIDSRGQSHLPIRMRDDEGVAPQKGQWAFLHAVFPGKVFEPDDPPVRQNMSMLESVEREGLVYGTGWISEGIWNYFGSFYAHAWLWLGRGSKAADILYAFANHASPLLAWREEQLLKGEGERVVGDMPHNWASAELIRLVRHLLVLERQNELHLFEGLPRTWLQPGSETRLRSVITEFGSMSLELVVSDQGDEASLFIQPPRRNPPERIVVHVESWPGCEGVLSFELKQEIRKTIRLN
ncbi:MAG: hypothetical protein JXR73_04020 [Candidatus Omnitrophica bacterium]|nr:hypothetical protein [Candidatus Omnitrophota bacterium]